MKIKAELLSDALASALPFVARKVIIPATAGFLIEAKDGKMQVSATDAMSGDITYVVGDTDEEFSFVVTADIIMPAISVMNKDGGEIDFTYSKKGLLLKNKKREANLTIMDAGDFPVLFRDFNGDVSSVDAEEFSETIKLTKTAMDPDNPRYTIAGIRYNGDNCYSIDGFRMAIVKEFSLGHNITLPGRSALAIHKILTGIDGNVEIASVPGKIAVKWDRGIVVSGLIDGPYPNCIEFVPEYKTSFLVSRMELIEATNMAAPASKQSENLLLFELNGDKLKVSGLSSIGAFESDLDTGSNKGEDVTFGLSYKYVQDAVSEMPGVFEIRVDTPDNMIIFSDGANYLYGIMPMKVKKS